MSAIPVASKGTVSPPRRRRQQRAGRDHPVPPALAAVRAGSGIRPSRPGSDADSQGATINAAHPPGGAGALGQPPAAPARGPQPRGGGSRAHRGAELRRGRLSYRRG